VPAPRNPEVRHLRALIASNSRQGRLEEAAAARRALDLTLAEARVRDLIDPHRPLSDAERDRLEGALRGGAA
jgi:hypothetical protein